MKTIVFDLDETLIHCNENQGDPCDVRVPVTFPTGESIEVNILHPGWDKHKTFCQANIGRIKQAL